MQATNNLIQLLDESTSKFPKKIALVFGKKRITYSQLNSISRKLASSFYDLGARKSDKIALWFHNCPEFVYSFFGALRLGATVVPINAMLKREEVASIIEDCQAKILICGIDKVSDSENILSRPNNLKILISKPVPKEKGIIIDFDSLVEKAKEFTKEIQAKEEDIAEIVYTSGTTGRLKGVCLSHKNLMSNIKSCSRATKFSKKDCVICILPLFHSFSLTVCMLLPLSRGAKIVIMRTVRPFKRVIRAVFKNKVTIFAGVPSLYNVLSETKLSYLKRLLSILLNPVRLFVSGAAALPSKVCIKFEKKFKRPLLEGYGLTEASPVVTLNPSKGLRKPGSVGVVLPRVKVKIIDKDGKELPIGEIGEILVKGDNVMKGYYNLEEETKKALRDGWLYTGDLAKIDKDGFIYIMGRIKEMINVRGFNVYPAEVENLIYKHPKIKEAAVVGVLHRSRGEVPIAFVVGKENLEEKELSGYLKANLALYKLPLKIFFRDTLPKNPTGKVLKKQLKAEVEGIFG